MTQNLFLVLALFLLCVVGQARAYDVCDDTSAHVKFTAQTGDKIFYIDTARNDKTSTRPIVILLHGSKYSHQDWCNIHLVSRLEKEGYRVIAADLPGFGKSVGGAKASRFANMRNDAGKFLSKLLQYLGAKKAAIISPSMSGGFSLPFVAEHPNRVSAYIPVAPVTRALLMNPKLTLKNSTMPVLHIRGSNDHPRTSALQNFPFFEEKVIEDAGHACYLDKPKAFNDLVVDFLKKHVQQYVKQ